jgi:diaminohydroxyphosphoribosylaminopyrimidine deaminase/5-amino-6-(5-phosphoribosylamino)uracil reductase
MFNAYVREAPLLLPVLQDDSALTVRDITLADEKGQFRQPLRVVLDTKARLPATAAILKQPGRTLQVIADHKASNVDSPAVSVLSCEQLQLRESDQGIDLHSLLGYLSETEQCNEVLVEAGARLAGAFIAARLVDELVVYMAPTLMGSDARPLLNWPLSTMDQQQRLSLTDVRQMGDDIRLTYCFI